MGSQNYQQQKLKIFNFGRLQYTWRDQSNLFSPIKNNNGSSARNNEENPTVFSNYFPNVFKPFLLDKTFTTVMGLIIWRLLYICLSYSLC